MSDRRPLPVEVLAAGEDDLGAHATGGAARSVRTARIRHVTREPACVSPTADDLAHLPSLDEWAAHVGDEPAGGLAGRFDECGACGSPALYAYCPACEAAELARHADSYRCGACHSLRAIGSAVCSRCGATC